MSIIQLTTENFEAETTEAGKTVLIDFFANWCGPCRMVAPIMEEIAGEADDSLKVCKVNVDEQPALAAKFGVMSIPTIVVLRGGEVTAKNVGAIPKQAILEMLK